MAGQRQRAVYEADMLVLGTGAAGCGAALAGLKAGLHVLMVDKSKLESSGCLGGGNDHFMAVLGTEEPSDSVDDLVCFFRKAFPEAALRGWGETMPELLHYLEGLGVSFAHRADGSYMRSVGFGQPGAWHIHITDGQLIKRRIGTDLRKRGAQVLDHVMITRILKENGRVTGAVGFHVLDGTFVVLRAGVVIAALGNTCNRVGANSTGNPYNSWHTPFDTGSQYALAYEAGAAVTRLDTGTKATLLPKGFGCAGMNGINGAGAHELNAMSERFMGRYHPIMENGPRQFQLLGTWKEQAQGRGPFFMDMRHCDAEVVRELQDVLMPGDKATFPDYCAQRGVDLTKAPMEVELGEIGIGGALLSGDDFSTTIPGLYNGCMLPTFSGSMSSGYLAATSAAGHMRGLSPLSAELQKVLDEEEERIFHPLEIQGDDTVSQAEFESAVRQIMVYYMGFVRNDTGMGIALEHLNMLERWKARMRASNLHELMMVHEAVHMHETCRMTVHICRERKHCGNCIYFRSDVEDGGDAKPVRLAVRQENGSPLVFHC